MHFNLSRRRCRMNFFALVAAQLAIWISAAVSAPVAMKRDVESVLESVRAALGFDDWSGAMTLMGSADTLGLDGGFELTFDDAGRFLRRTDGRLGETFGFDGKEAWQINFGRTPRILDLGDREDALIEAWLITGWWAAKGAPLTFALVDGDEGEGLVLSFKFVDGHSSGLIELDSRSHRPRVIRYVIDQLEQEMRLDDFAAHDDLFMPGLITIEGEADLTTRFAIHAAQRVKSPDRDRFASHFTPFTDVTFDAAIPSALHVERAPTGHLMVKASIDGHDDLGWFFFDTGAGVNCLSTPVAEALGLEPFGSVAASGVGGTIEAHFYQSTTLTVGPVTLLDPVFGGLDLSFLERAIGVKVAGIIGYDLIARCVVEYDGAGEAIALHEPAAHQLPGGSWQELFLYDGHPNVTASLEGHEGVFKIDTGARGTVTIHAPAVERLDLLNGRETTDGSRGGVGGRVPIQSGSIAYFELGGRRFENPQVDFAVEHTGAFADPYTLGNLGGEFLKVFIMVLDYQGRRIALVEK